MKATGWYGMDYAIVEAQSSRCNWLVLSANFGTDGKIYTLLQMPSREVGGIREERWIQLGVNVGPARAEGNEDIVGVVGKELGGGWVSFDVSLDDVVKRAFGGRRLVYGEHGKLLKVRFRGFFSISEVEFYRG
jgi:hypothetical protein